MASISDVENALVALSTGALYPNGSPPSALGYPVKIYPGWPDPGTLDADMVESGGHPMAAHVSIYPLPQERNTSRYPVVREEVPAPATTYTLTAAGQVITVGGSAPVTYFAQNLAVFVNGKPYVVKATTGETAAQLAAALQALIVADVVGTTVLGAAITLPSGARIGPLRVGSTGSTLREVGRQEKQFQIATWTSNPASRDAIDSLITPILADQRRMTLPDGSVARLTLQGSRDDDFTQKQRIYRRSRIVTVEYATTITETAAQLVAGEVDLYAPDNSLLNTSYS